MTKEEKARNNNLGKRLVMAPAVMVLSLGLCLVCLAYLNKFTIKNGFSFNNEISGVQTGLESTEITKSAEKDISFWSQIVEENPTYRDGWIRLVVGYYEKGEIDKAIKIMKTVI